MTTLSDKGLKGYEFRKVFYSQEDVRDFIRELKRGLCLRGDCICDDCLICRHINELAGEDLI